MKWFAGLAAAIFFVVPASAQDCSKASNQAEMNACAAEALQKADKELNALYGQIKNRLKDEKPKAALVTEAQRAWIAFRDAECKFAGSGVEGGSLQPMIVDSCKEDLTQARNKALAEYLKCEEGDMSCPVPAN